MKSRKKLIIIILAVFAVLGGFVSYIAGRISREMSQSAIANLSESLNLIKSTMEVYFRKEAEYQKLIAEEVAILENPEEFVLSYDKNDTIMQLSIVFAGQTEGISDAGGAFLPDTLDFSGGNTVGGLPFSSPYINSMGTWAYTMKCPVVKDGEEIATLYAEYIYDSFEKVLPNRLYNSSATLYIMDSRSERFLLKPREIGERMSGHLDLDDFYRANNIKEEGTREEIARILEAGESMMFYHDVQRTESLIYMWEVNDGTLYLIGYVPVEAIQREGRSVNQYMLIVVIVMLAAFCICCMGYFFYERQQDKLRMERELERETHNRQLAEALQTAQIANSSKTMFLSNMSHDIRTPMNAVLGFAALLARDADNPVKVREYTKKITASGQHLLGLINDVLDVSKIESGKAVLTLGEFTLSGMISSVDAIVRPMARERKQSFEVSVAGIRHERLIGDETRLNQILINLLSNAVKYTQEGGGIWLRIMGLEQRSSQYEHIRIEVEDNGFGMSQDYLKVIFDAFTRAENSTTNKVQGTGLGMAITKNIVELMGGTIDVASQEGKGSLFTVELELRIAGEEPDGNFLAELGVSRILIADGDEGIRRDIRSMMEEAQVAVDAASDGDMAVRMAYEGLEKGLPYDAVLLAWKMPGLDGIEAARQIRAGIPGDFPLFLLTAYGWDGIEEEALRAGVDGFLAKPFFLSALKEQMLVLKEKERVAGDKEGILEGRHFLVAEDNEINAEILQELLRAEGATCEVAEDGKAALARFCNGETEEFDAILMDVQMPVMNGYEATRRIRALERKDAADIPIIAMTANAFAEDVRDAMNAGMNAHVSKPVDLETLKRAIGKLCAERNER